MRRGGFTLIELLVVIAIIAILAAILFPVFAKLKERARMTNCISNQRQLFIACSMYQDEYDGRYPGPGYTWTWAHAVPWQKPVLVPYTKNSEIFFCPSTPAWARNYTPPGATEKLGTSYSYNYDAVQNPGAILKPAETMLMGELWDSQYHMRQVPPKSAASDYTWAVMVQTMCDGHSKPTLIMTPW